MAALAFAACASAAKPDHLGPPQAACPATDHQIAASRTPGAHGKLVPHRPTGLTLCRYRGLNPDPKQAGTLQRTQPVAAAQTIAWLTRHLNALPRFPSGPMSCPADDGSEIVAIFHYAKAPDDPVTVDLTGCQGVTNGHLRRWAATDQPLISRLESLTQ